METSNILSIIAIAFLIWSFFIGKNAIWGGLTLGVLIVVIIWIINAIQGSGFNRLLSQQILNYSVLVGALFEILGRNTKKRKAE